MFNKITKKKVSEIFTGKNFDKTPSKIFDGGQPIKPINKGKDN